MKRKRMISVLAVLAFLGVLGGNAFLCTGLHREVFCWHSMRAAQRVGEEPSLLDSAQAEEQVSDRLPAWTASAFTGQGLLYRDYIKKNGEFTYKGLYYQDCQSPDAKEQVISDNYGGYLDVLDEDVYYVDNEYNIFHYHLGTGKTELLRKSDGDTVGSILLAGDSLYFLGGTLEGEENLNALHLPTGKVKTLLENVNWHYLYRYQDSVAVLSKDYKNFMVCDAERGLVATYPCYKGEITGCREDGSVIFSNGNQIIKADGFGQEEGEVLFQSADHIYSTLMKGNEIVITTSNGHGMMQLFVYNLEQGSCEKLANVDNAADAFSEDYIACNSGGVAMGVELIDRHTGEIRTFAIH